jgi:hypothetical protein
MRTLPLFFVFISFVSITATAGKNTQVYTWIDNNGTVHYSDRPVQGKDSEILTQEKNNNVATLAPKNNQWQEEYQKNKNSKAEEKKINDDKSQKKETYCRQLKTRLKVFERGGRIYTPTETGERNFYSDDDVVKEIKQLKKKLKKKCH